MKVFFQMALLLIAACSIHCENTDAQSQYNLVNEKVETSARLNANFASETTKNVTVSNSTSPSANSSNALIDEMEKATENPIEHDLVVVVHNESKPSSLNQKREIENLISNEIKPFLLFPTLPFMFSKKESEFSNAKDLESHHDKPNDPKPFVFFKFSVNIRQIPLANDSINLNDSKIVNVKKSDQNQLPTENLKKSAKSDGRKRRNTSNRESFDFLDSISPFPAGNIDEFFSKPDFFFPDVLFHRKASKKSNRKKRDMKKSGFKNDLKFFLDIFDEAFTKTKRDLELANPLFDFFRDGNEGKSKKSGNVPNDVSVENLRRNSRGKVYDDREIIPQTDFLKRTEVEKPMIVVDKFIKIGEVDLPRTRLENHEKLKLIRKKRRESKELKRKSMRNSVGGKSDSQPNASSLHYKEGPGHVKRESPQNFAKNGLKYEPTPKTTVDNSGDNEIKHELNDIKIKANDTVFHINVTSDRDGLDSTIPKMNNLIRRVVNSTENILNFAGDLIKVMDSMETQFKDKTGKDGKEEKEKSEGSAKLAGKDGNIKKPSYGDVEKNITKLLNQFMVFFKNLDSGKLDAIKEDSFDWSVNETLQNSNKIYGKRSKKNADFAEESLDREKKRQVADLNFLFLTVTLPTIIISALLLLVCFFSFQVRGKICTKLFKPRRVLVIEDETPTTRK